MYKKPLIHLYARYNRRSLSLTSRFLAKPPSDPRETGIWEAIHQDGRAYLVIKLQHLWGEICRELIVRSAIGECETRTGRTLPRMPGIKFVRDIPGITQSGPGTSWEDPPFAIKQANRLQLVNYNEIGLGLGSVSNHLANLKCVRNFIVHPNKNTQGKYRQMARDIGFAGLPPDDLLNQFLRGGATVFEDWGERLRIAAWNAVG